MKTEEASGKSPTKAKCVSADVASGSTCKGREKYTLLLEDIHGACGEMSKNGDHADVASAPIKSLGQARERHRVFGSGERGSRSR